MVSDRDAPPPGPHAPDDPELRQLLADLTADIRAEAIGGLRAAGAVVTLTSGEPIESSHDGPMPDAWRATHLLTIRSRRRKNVNSVGLMSVPQPSAFGGVVYLWSLDEHMREATALPPDDERPPNWTTLDGRLLYCGEYIDRALDRPAFDHAFGSDAHLLLEEIP